MDIEIYKFPNIFGDRPTAAKFQKIKKLPVFQIKDPKSVAGKSGSRKRPADRKKQEEKQSTEENQKHEGTNCQTGENHEGFRL